MITELNDESLSPSGCILVVDDHARARESMMDILGAVGNEAHGCSSAKEALALLKDKSFDVILTDLKMPGMDGLEFIKALHGRRIDAQIVMVTAHATVGSAVDAMRHGAFDYIEKPFDADQLEQLVGRAIRHGAAIGRRSSVPKVEGSEIAMIGESPTMQRMRSQIAQVAPTNETLLISGESGTGKELVAQTIHAMSGRACGPLVSLNCPALSPQLMESELFGHERGAFTSADAPRIGRFELADGGTILLDEVSEIELGLQAKLLRVLQERSFERVGSSQSRSVDVRVVAATNRDLQREVSEGRFREDLYFRLAVVPLLVPPLRQRREDVPKLAEHFLIHAADRLGQPPCQLDAQGLDLLINYQWPGNVRELENLMTRVSVLHQSQTVGLNEIEPWLIGAGGQTESNPIEAEGTPIHSPLAAGTSLQEMERALIETTLEQFNGHREKTAKALGIGVRTLANKLRAYGYAPRSKSFGDSSYAEVA